jgi:PAS domain-containing protein
MIDADGRLVEADSRLQELNGGAGGNIGQPLAVPQLATLARLAQRLGILISRSVVVADGANDLEMWVRAEPVATGVRLALSGWKPQPAEEAPADEAIFVRTGGDWLWETDAASRLIFLSPEAAQHHGFEASDYLGRPITALFSLSENKLGTLPILGALGTRQRFDAQPATLRPTGQPAHLTATPRLDAQGHFTGYIGAVQLSPAPASTVAGNDGGVTPAFSAQLDRALRGPLDRIIANADSISAQADGPIRQDYAEYAADIAHAGRHLKGLVDDLVDLQAVERPDFQPAMEPIDLADVARRAAGLLQVRAADRHIRIDRPGPQDTLPATGEFRRVLQILVNLIGNAVRYSPAEGMVWVRAEREGKIAAVIVADQGKGIAEADQTRIFEKFARVDPSEPGGSGLGLYIARRLARAMGGDIVVDSAPGQGARFVLTLPTRE